LPLLLVLACARTLTPVEQPSAEPRTGRDDVLSALQPRLERNQLGGVLSTLLSSLSFALDAITPEGARRLSGELGYSDFKLELVDGTQVGGIFFECTDGPPGPKPLLMASFGLLQDRWGTESAKFHALYLKKPDERIGAHVLILDHPTGGSFYANNGHLSVGAYDDGRMWIEVARHLDSQMDLSGIHLLGVSMSGQTVVHALIEDDRLGARLFDSGMAVSIAPDFREAPGRQFADLPTRSGVENTWKPGLSEPPGRIFALGMQSAGLGLLVARLFVPSYRAVRPPAELEIDRKDLAVFFREAFEARITFLRTQSRANWNPDFSLDDLQAFMTTTRIAAVIDRVRTPLVLVSARDDPAVHRALFEEVVLSAGDNMWIAAHETLRGGHFGFHVSYGTNYLGNVARLMMMPEILENWNEALKRRSPPNRKENIPIR